MEKPENCKKLFKIKKPWDVCLVENKSKWKEQAIRGIKYYIITLYK